MQLLSHISKVTTRPARLAVGLACAAVLLPATALAASGASGAASARAATGRCTGADIMEWVGEPNDNGVGSSYYQVEFSNVGRVTCTLSGYPRVVAVDGHNRQVGGPAGREASAMPVLTLRPLGSAHVILRVSNGYGACSHPVETPMMRVYPPHQTAYGLVPITAGACAGHVSMGVEAVHAGVGIPLHTTR